LVDLYDRFAATDFYWFCEKVYRIIYGSQIRLLQDLQARGAAGASVEDLLPFFLQHLAAVRQVNPAYEGRFDAYMGYLSASQLVIQDPSALGRYRIAPHGVGLLAYLPWAGIPPQKAW
jgi:predicted GNAT superfamily acetyltransferase